MAGFTNSISGVWAFVEVQEGDYISFLYGAKAYNLYVVERKEAIRDVESIQPWSSVTFKQSGRTYNFPFWLHLQPVRRFEESLVKPEFAYVAENLLLRGGYRKTHFQADQTILQCVSQMGKPWRQDTKELALPEYSTFSPRFVAKREDISIPEIFQFHEFILQSLIKQYLRKEKNLSSFLSDIDVNGPSFEEFEVLSEKAFPEGHIDILIKEAAPVGVSRMVILEVKTGAATQQDLFQLKHYAEEIGNECIGAVLISKGATRAVIENARKQHIKLVSYSFWPADKLTMPSTFKDLLDHFTLQIVAT